MRVSDVVSVARSFVTQQTGLAYSIIESVDALEKESRWRVIVNVTLFGKTLKEVLIDDNDGNVIGYRDHRAV